MQPEIKHQSSNAHTLGFKEGTIALYTVYVRCFLYCIITGPPT